MKTIFNTAKELVLFYIAVIKPECEEVMEQPLFKFLAIPGTIAATIGIIGMIWKWIINRD